MTKGKIAEKEEEAVTIGNFKVEKTEVGTGYDLYRESYENDEKLFRLRRD